jgi:hypothetical protein
MVSEKRIDSFDFAGSFEQAWVQYKVSILHLLPYSFFASLPVFLIFYFFKLGVFSLFFFQGFALLVLSEAVFDFSNESSPKIILKIKSHFWEFFKNGFVLSVFLFPLLILGFIVFVIPSIFLFSLFMFSFFQVVLKRKFAIDASMESFRLGKGFRLPLFLFSMIFYFSFIVVAFFTQSFPLFFLLFSAFLLPYFFLVIKEIFEQLEMK